MDILRIIKLKQLNDDLENLNEKEKLFFSFFNGLTKNDNYYKKNNDYYFECDLEEHLNIRGVTPWGGYGNQAD